MNKGKILVVVGPTASGKTNLSVELAKRFNGEIVSADSMQIYKYMDIATAKPTEEEKQGIPHHMMDFLEPEESYSVGQYVVDAQKIIEDIHSRNKLPVLCGGTGLYVDALLKGGNFQENSSDIEIRNKYLNLGYENGAEYLLEILKKFDPQSAERLASEKNIKRIARAIEFYMVTGKTITQQNSENSFNEYNYNCFIIGLTATNREFLYDRINKRVDIMVENGLIDEVKSMYDYNFSTTSSKAIGHKEIIPFIENRESLEFCIEKLKRETRRYAKRQLTWFRRNSDINWIDIDVFSKEKLLEYCFKMISDRGFLNG